MLLQTILVSAQTPNAALQKVNEYLDVYNTFDYQILHVNPCKDYGMLKKLANSNYDVLNHAQRLAESKLRDIPPAMLLQYVYLVLGKYAECIPFFNLVNESYYLNLDEIDHDSTYLVNVQMNALVA